MARKILITSGKGGVGKTSVCAHLGYSLSKMGERVVAIDLDFGLNNLDVVMGVESKVGYDIKDVFDGKCRVKQTLVECSPTLAVIPSRHTFDKEISGQNVKYLIEGLDPRFDFMLLDSPAGIDSGFHRSVCAADEVIVVVTPTLSSLRDADKVMTILKNYELSSVSVVINKVRGDLLLSGKMLDVTEIESVLKTPVIGCIPEDDEILLTPDCKLSFGRAEKAYKMLAKRIVKGHGKVYDSTAFYRGFLGGLRRSIKRSV